MIEGEKGIGSFLRRKKMNRPWMWMLALLLWGSVSVAEKNPNILFISSALILEIVLKNIRAKAKIFFIFF